MITQTTETGLQALIYLVLRGREEPVTPRRIAEELGFSPTYLSKTMAMLVKAGLLSAQRGAKGGVALKRPAERVTLLEIVEALQGKVFGRYCDSQPASLRGVCNFHRAMLEVHEATVGILGRWTLSELAARPFANDPAVGDGCVMSALRRTELRRPRKDKPT